MTPGSHDSRDEPEYVANVLVDAVALGDNGAARKWGIHIRTVGRYRARMKKEPELAALVAEKNAEVSHDLAVLRVQFLREALAEATKKLPAASLYEVSGAIKIVGELHQASEMIGDNGALGPSVASESDTEIEGVGKVVRSEAHDAIFPRH